MQVPPLSAIVREPEETQTASERPWPVVKASIFAILPPPYAYCPFDLLLDKPIPA